VTEDDGGNAEEARGLSLGQKTPGRKTVIALVLFGAVAVLAWQTMEPGKFRTLVFVILGGLALRVALGFRRSNIDSETR
jgi:predicted membrane chloride channel (bestrophin family)